jgi:hypothetical protein
LATYFHNPIDPDGSIRSTRTAAARNQRGGIGIGVGVGVAASRAGVKP